MEVQRKKSARPAKLLKPEAKSEAKPNAKSKLMQLLSETYQYQTITLSEMKKVSLMKRVDTKYVTTLDKLHLILQALRDDYFVQETDGEQQLPYYTLYYDTPDCQMFSDHQRGKPNRQKVRIRKYCQTGQAFLEVKSKKGNGQTRKKRIAVPDEHHSIRLSENFLAEHCPYQPQLLEKKIENHFYRTTLVSKALNERVTIDTGLSFYHHGNACSRSLDDLVIIELKRDGHRYSKLLEVLNDMYIPSSSFSKYCVGMVLTDPSMKYHRFKEKLHPLARRIPSLQKCYPFKIEKYD